MSAPFNGAKALLDADSGDIDFFFIGDSTGETSTEWVGYFMYLLHYYYPSFTVSYSEWYNGGTLTWTTPTTVYTGSGSNTVRIWCAGDGGAGCDYFTAREVAIIQHPTDVDFCTIALGHNTTRGESDFNALVEMVESNWPSAHITMVVQNPRYDDFALGATTAATVATVASTYDTGVVDIRARFLSDPDPQTNLMGDNVHPNTLGRRVWGETTWLAIYPQGGFPVATLDDAVLLLQAKNYSGTGDWLDESGNGLDATVVFGGGGSFSATGDATLPQPHFNGPNGNIFTIADDPLLDFGPNVSGTWMAVFMLNDIDGAYNEVIMDKGGFTGPSQGGWSMTRSSGTSDLRVAAAATGGSTSASLQALPADNTLMVGVGRRDAVADSLRAFVDGVEGSTASAQKASDWSSAQPLTIGIRTNPQNFAWMRGRLVAVAVWRVALTDSEIASIGAQLANTGKARLTTLFPPAARW